MLIQGRFVWQDNTRKSKKEQLSSFVYGLSRASDTLQNTKEGRLQRLRSSRREETSSCS